MSHVKLSPVCIWIGMCILGILLINIDRNFYRQVLTVESNSFGVLSAPFFQLKYPKINPVIRTQVSTNITTKLLQQIGISRLIEGNIWILYNFNKFLFEYCQINNFTSEWM